MRKIVTSLVSGILALMSCTQGPEPCGPVPTEDQLRWQDMEMYAFIHYSLNTYTDLNGDTGTRTRDCSTPATWTAASGRACASRRA